MSAPIGCLFDGIAESVAFKASLSSSSLLLSLLAGELVLQLLRASYMVRTTHLTVQVPLHINITPSVCALGGNTEK